MTLTTHTRMDMRRVLRPRYCPRRGLVVQAALAALISWPYYNLCFCPRHRVYLRSTISKLRGTAPPFLSTSGNAVPVHLSFIGRRVPASPTGNFLILSRTRLGKREDDGKGCWSLCDVNGPQLQGCRQGNYIVPQLSLELSFGGAGDPFRWWYSSIVSVLVCSQRIILITFALTHLLSQTCLFHISLFLSVLSLNLGKPCILQWTR